MTDHTVKTATILDELVSGKRAALELQEALEPFDALVTRTMESPSPIPLAPALRGDRVRVIAEIKRASPAAGLLESQFHPAARAHQYVEGGAAAISILTEERRFLGRLDDLISVREALVRSSRLPLLRKDFLFAPYQLYEARAAGADAVLLIVAILEQSLLRDLIQLAEQLQLTALVEIHDADEAARALSAGATVIGINNRDLHTFKTSLDVTERLRPELPVECLVISESGIRDRDDVRRLADAGVDAILVGEALMRSGDVVGAVGELAGVTKPAGTGLVPRRSQGGTG